MPRYRSSKEQKIIDKAVQNMQKLDEKMNENKSDSMLHDVKELGLVQVDDKCPCKNK